MFNIEKLLKVIDPEPVLIDQSACLRVRHARSSCQDCSDVCPAAAIGFANRKVTVDSGRCTRCGLCLGACPTAALQVRGIDEAALEGASAVRCSRAAGDGVEIPCLGALAPDHIIDLGSLQPGFTLVAGECETCPMARGGAAAKANLAAAVETLKSLGQKEIPVWGTVAKTGAASPQSAVNRRELLILWGRGAVKTGRTLLPAREVNPVKLPAKVPARRLCWLKRYAPPEHQERITWPTRAVQTGCNGCNICVAFCPTGALTSREAGDGAWTLSFQAAACVDCETCIGLCPRRVMQPAETPAVRLVLSGLVRELVTVPGSDRPPGTGFRPLR